MQSAEKPCLYERLGGVYSIATVVDDFIDRVMSDPRLNANPLVDEAHHRVPPAGFKYLVTEMVCWATGGPQKYTGKSMADSHSHFEDYQHGVGGILGRFSADAGQIRPPPPSRRPQDQQYNHSRKSRRTVMTQKVIEVVGTSKESFAKAAENAVAEAAKTVRGLKCARVAELEMELDGKKRAQYRATTKIYFDIEH